VRFEPRTQVARVDSRLPSRGAAPGAALPPQAAGATAVLKCPDLRTTSRMAFKSKVKVTMGLDLQPDHPMMD